VDKSKIQKIALATSGDSLDSPLDRRFGRAKSFLIYNLENDSFTIAANSQTLNIVQGAGIQSAQNVVESGAQCVIGGHCGPKAFRVLCAAGISVFGCEEGTVQEAINLWKDGKLVPMETADVEGHWV